MEDILDWSAAEHEDSKHGVTEAAILAWPVVHWHFISAVEQPELERAETRQGSYHKLC